MRNFGFVAALAAGLVAGGGPAAAEVDFAGKRIEMIVGAAAGGSADIVARFVAEGLSRELPGQPAILVRNMTAGGSIEAANYFQREARPDGLMLFYSTPSSIMNPLFRQGEDQIAFDPSTWVQFLASAGGYVYVGSEKSGIGDLDDLKAAIAEGRALPSGMSSPAGVSLMYVMAMEVLGANLKPAFNVGSADSTTGFLRGEFVLLPTTMANYRATLEPLDAAEGVRPLFTLGQIDGAGNLIRDPVLPDVPHLGEAYELIHGKAPEGEAFEIYKVLIAALIANARGFMLAGETPQEIVDAYSAAAERAFADVQDDPQGLEIIGPIPMTYGEEAGRRLEQMLEGLTPRLVEYLTDLYQTKFGVPL